MSYPSSSTIDPQEKEIYSPTVILDVITSCDRSGSPRSRRINAIIDEIKAEEDVARRQVLVEKAIFQAVCPGNMDVAVTTLHLLRIPFNTSLASRDAQISHQGQDERVYVRDYLSYCLDTLLHCDRLREFLELADAVNELTTAFCAVGDPEPYWRRVHRWLRRPDPRVFIFRDGEEDLEQPELWTPRLCIAGTVRRVLKRSLEENLSAEEDPVDLEGIPINEEFYAHVQREFWKFEREVRLDTLASLADREVIQLDRSVVDAWVQEPRAAAVNRFADIVIKSRVELAYSLLADDPTERDRLRDCVNSIDLSDLGIQGLARLLPRDEDDYIPDCLRQTCALAAELSWFYTTLPKDVNNWKDGWFERVGTLMRRVTE